MKGYRSERWGISPIYYSYRRFWNDLTDEERKVLQRIHQEKKLSTKEYLQLREENKRLLKDYISVIDEKIAESITDDELSEYVNAIMTQNEIIRTAVFVYQEKSFTNAPIDDKRILDFMRLYEIE